MRFASNLLCLSSFLTKSSLPTRIISISGCSLTVSTAPSTLTEGAKSPPIASRATLIFIFRLSQEPCCHCMSRSLCRPCVAVLILCIQGTDQESATGLSSLPFSCLFLTLCVCELDLPIFTPFCSQNIFSALLVWDQILHFYNCRLLNSNQFRIQDICLCSRHHIKVSSVYSAKPAL
jgi:hypothetical protein